jgi:O-antigen/teichoic acid export membrane protein
MTYLATIGLRNVIVRNTLILALSQASIYLIPLVTTPYVARVLGAEHYGLLGIASNIIGNLLILTDWGFSLSATREIARSANDPQALRRIFWETLAAKSLLGLASLLVIAAIMAFLGISSELSWIVFAGWLQVLPSAIGVGWFLQGLEAMGLMATGVFIGRLLTIPLIFLFVHGPSDTMRVVAIAGIGSIVSVSINILNALQLRPLLPVSFTFSSAFRQLANGWHIFMSAGATTLYTQVNVILVGIAAGPAQAGLLYGAERLQRAGKSLVGPLSAAIFPRVNKLLVEDRAHAIRLVRRLLIIQGGATFVFSLATFVIAPYLIPLFLGAGYEGAVPALRWLSWTLFLVGLSNVLGVQIMLPFGMQRTFTRIIAGSGLFNLAAIMPLAYYFGATGASVSIVVTEGIVTALMGFAVWRAGILSGKGKPFEL